jgi:hypothetical protein
MSKEFKAGYAMRYKAPRDPNQAWVARNLNSGGYFYPVPFTQAHLTTYDAAKKYVALDKDLEVVAVQLTCEYSPV